MFKKIRHLGEKHLVQYITLHKLCCVHFLQYTLVSLFFPGIYFSLRGTTYQNHSLVTLEDIGENDNALLCLTDYRACCGRAQSPGGRVLGDWHYPNGTRVPNTILGYGYIWDFYRNRGQSVVRMNRRSGGVNGIYHCVIPDTACANQTIYIGVYTVSTGEWCIYTAVVLTIRSAFGEECMSLKNYRVYHFTIKITYISQIMVVANRCSLLSVYLQSVGCIMQKVLELQVVMMHVWSLEVSTTTQVNSAWFKNRIFSKLAKYNYLYAKIPSW